MDSKQKYWKRKYRPRNPAAAAACSTKKTEQKNEKSPDQSEESEDDGLKQPIPEGGWYPEYDSSSSDLEDFESLTNIPQRVSISTSKSHIIKKDVNCDKNWFDKELDNVQVTSEVPTKKKNQSTEKHENKEEANFQIIENKFKASNSKIQSAVKKKDIVNINDSEEDELEFLLSLKESIHTGPVIVKNNIENDRKLPVSNNTLMNQKPIKSIDLDKWLDSILDD